MSRIKDSIRDYFFVNPNSKLRVREIERLLNLPLPSVIRYCKELEKEGILTIFKVGTIKFYTASRNQKYFVEKMLYNIKSINNTQLIDYIRKELSNPVIILFGSYSKGEDTEQSDIDIYIETPSKKKISLESYERKLKRKIQLFQHKNIREIKNMYLANNIINGITLNKELQVFENERGRLE